MLFLTLFSLIRDLRWVTGDQIRRASCLIRGFSVASRSMLQKHLAELSRVNLIPLSIRPVVTGNWIRHPWSLHGFLSAFLHHHVAPWHSSFPYTGDRTLWCRRISTPAHTHKIHIHVKTNTDTEKNHITVYHRDYQKQFESQVQSTVFATNTIQFLTQLLY